MNAVRSPIAAGAVPGAGYRLGLASWLGLAAAPIFAGMAVLTGFGAGASMGMAMGASPLDGMATMYGLMAVFHLPAWLRLLERRASGNFDRQG